MRGFVVSRGVVVPVALFAAAVVLLNPVAEVSAQAGGWQLDAFAFYQQERVAKGLTMPCEFNLFQRLTISSCGSGSSATVYRSNVILRGIISATGASSMRDGVLVGRPLTIQ